MKLPESGRTKKQAVFVDSLVSKRIRESYCEITEGRNTLFFDFQKASLKVVVLVLLIALNWFELAAIGQTFAYFFDAENSSVNSFSAGTLDFSLSSPSNGFEPPEIAAKMMLGDAVTRAVKIIKEGSLSFQYDIAAVKIAGDDDFCEALRLKAEMETVTEYDGPLLEFALGPIIFSESADDWFFTVTLPADAAETLQGRICQFRFVFRGWQEDFVLEPLSLQGNSQGSFNGDPGKVIQALAVETPPEAPPLINGFSDIEELINSLGSEYWVKPTSEFSPLIDAYADENHPTMNYGGRKTLEIETTKPGSARKRTFIKFDFNFPERTTILAATLKLYLKVAPVADRIYEVRRVLQGWKEKSPGGLNWRNQPAVDSQPTSTVTLSRGQRKWVSWEVASDLQKFISDTPNHGWRLNDQTEESRLPYSAKFRSRESSLNDWRPVLEVTFRAPEATTAYPVINEVYYEVATNKRNDPKNEWVEIYNPTAQPIDISGWQICDKLACDLIPQSWPIPAKGFAVISPKESTWRYWPEIPEAAVKIVLDSLFGVNGLDNRGDRVVLKNTERAVVDAMSYGSDTSQMNPSVPLSGEGKSLARIIKGYDTNFAKDWVINSRPNPGSNPAGSEIETIRFTAQGAQVLGAGEELMLLTEAEQLPEEVIAEDLAAEEEPLVSPNEEGVGLDSLPGELLEDEQSEIIETAEELVNPISSVNSSEDSNLAVDPKTILPELLGEEIFVVNETLADTTNLPEAVGEIETSSEAISKTQTVLPPEIVESGSSTLSADTAKGIDNLPGGPATNKATAEISASAAIIEESVANIPEDASSY